MKIYVVECGWIMESPLITEHFLHKEDAEEFLDAIQSDEDCEWSGLREITINVERKKYEQP